MPQLQRYAWLMLLILLLLPSVVFAQDAQSIAIGDTIEGVLSEAMPTRVYAFEAERDQVVTITMVSDTVDTYLTLQDAEGRTLATDDDGAGSLDARIAAFRIPADGTYTILAASYESARAGGFSEGSFTLTLEEDQSALEYGFTIEGTLTSSEPSAFYTFTGEQGDTILITMIGDSGLDTYLYLYQGTDTTNQIASNDDGAGNLNSLIGPFSLPESGTYTIRATSYSGQATGSFTLTLERAEVATLEIGESVEGRFTAQRQFLYYQFTGEAGDIIDLTAEGGAALGVSMVLNGPDGFQVNYSDSYSGSDPRISAYQLTQTGTYVVIIRTLESGTQGKITLRFDRSELASLDEGVQKISFGSSVTRSTLSFTGDAGETVTMTLSLTGGDQMSPTVSVSQSGTTFTYISSSSVKSLTVTFFVPSSGQVLVQIEEYSYRDLEIEVMLERAEA